MFDVMTEVARCDVEDGIDHIYERGRAAGLDNSSDPSPPDLSPLAAIWWSAGYGHGRLQVQVATLLAENAALKAAGEHLGISAAAPLVELQYLTVPQSYVAPAFPARALTHRKQSIGLTTEV